MGQFLNLIYKENSFAIPIVNTDLYQDMITSYLNSKYFPWLFVYLIINIRNWKTPVSFILITHWYLKSIGQALNTLTIISPPEPNKYFPFNTKNWIYYSLGEFFDYFGGIIGDWYLLVRTKAIIKDNKKLKIIYLTCIIHTIGKIFTISIYFSHIPIDLRIKNDQGEKVWDLINTMSVVFFSYNFSFITNIFYDLSVIIVLKKNIFEKKNVVVKNSFLEKFKQISEYRIYYSMIATFLFIPFFSFQVLSSTVSCLSKDGVCYFDGSDDQFDYIRYLNCYFMYIDQILIRYYYNKKNIENNKNIITLNSSFDANIRDSTYYLNNLQDLNLKENKTEDKCHLIEYSVPISAMVTESKF
ncbi:hypothetical protein PIROE2DRAFT_2933 [Piromyces sp. E2]|nr:hypothetical protein PIROE2DRAFT_2933 [Piromyces sp. E2]|eukprot:OUM69227.1 hypothetical protein PIROE2DRAFT_2933 [Piromyces sp. E2]